MNRPFLFLAGEFRITMPLVFSCDLWQHTMTSLMFELNSDGSFYRKGRSEQLRGAIFYADVENEDMRRQNWNFFLEHHIPCWPDPAILRALDDRHIVMKKVLDAKLIEHPVLQGEYGMNITLPYPFVVKTGNEHRGQGKFLVTEASKLLIWEGTATIEPFFEGISCRVLWIGDDWYSYRFDNEQSWIKNTSGAELSMYPEMPKAVVEHSRKVKDLFGLEICGIDYIVGKDSWHFLEYNMFPGLDVSDSVTSVANAFLREKMQWVEEQVNNFTYIT